MKSTISYSISLSKEFLNTFEGALSWSLSPIKEVLMQEVLIDNLSVLSGSYVTASASAP